MAEDIVVSQSDLPTEGRWCWLLVLGNVIVGIFLPSTLLIFGVVLVQLTEVYGFTYLIVSIIPALIISLSHLLGPLSERFVKKYSSYSASTVGILLTCIGVGLCFVSVKLPWFCVGYGVLGGVGYSLALPRGRQIITAYFGRQRNAAQNISSLGSTVSLAVMPPLAYFLCDALSLRGAMLVWSAVSLNALLGAFLHRLPNAFNKSKGVGERNKVVEVETKFEPVNHRDDPIVEAGDQAQAMVDGMPSFDGGSESRQRSASINVPTSEPVYVQRYTGIVPNYRSVSQEPVFKSFEVLPQTSEDIQSLNAFSRSAEDRYMQRRPESFLSIRSADSFRTARSCYYSTDRISSITQYFDARSNFSSESCDNIGDNFFPEQQSDQTYNRSVFPSTDNANKQQFESTPLLIDGKYPNNVHSSRKYFDVPSQIMEESTSRENSSKGSVTEIFKEGNNVHAVDNRILKDETALQSSILVTKNSKISLCAMAISVSLKRQVYYSYIIYLPAVYGIIRSVPEVPYLLTVVAVSEFLARMIVTSIPRIRPSSDTRYSSVISSVLCCISIIVLLTATNVAFFFFSSCIFGLAFGIVLFVDHSNVVHIEEIRYTSIAITIVTTMAFYPVEGYLLDLSDSSMPFCVFLLCLSLISMLLDVANVLLTRGAKTGGEAPFTL